MTTASGTPITIDRPNPASVSHSVDHVCPGNCARWAQASLAINDGGGRTNFAILKRCTPSSQSTTSATSAAAGNTYSVSVRRSVGGDGTAAAAKDQSSNFVGVVTELGRGLYRHRARTRELHGDDALDMAGTRRHHDHAIAERDRLRDAVGHEHDRLASLLPDAQQLEAH